LATFEWADSTTSWLPLIELKETNMLETAEYVKANLIIDVPALDWWAPLPLKKGISRHPRRTYHVQGSRYKFGIKIHNTVHDAMKLDTVNDNMLWLDAMKKRWRT